MDQIQNQAPRQRVLHSDDQSLGDADSIIAAHDAAFETNDQGLIDNPLLHLKPEEVDSVAKAFVRQSHLELYEDTFIKVNASRSIVLD